MQVRRRRRTAAAAAITGVLALSCAAPAWSADTQLAEGNGFVPGGAKVDLSIASGEGSKLSPGLYSSTLPVDETPRYAVLHRGEGERLEVSVVGSATWKNNAWRVTTGSQRLAVELTTEDGETTCGTSSGSISVSTTPGLLTTSVAIDPTATQRSADAGGSHDEACRKATSYRLQVKRSQDGDDATPMPVQIAVVTTPKVSGTPEKAKNSDLNDMTTQPLSTSQEVSPGNGFAGATTVGAGGYDLKAVPGRRMFFRVHLGWGQRMSVGWQLPKNGASYKPKQDLSLSMQVFDPALTPATMSGSASNTGYLFSSGSSEGEELGAFTAPILYGNADLTTSGGSDEARWHTMPGWYYVTLDIAPNSGGDKLDSTTPIDSVLSVRVTGEPKAGPNMDVEQPDPGTLSTAGDGGTSPLVWGGALVLGLGAVAGVAFVMRRRFG